MKAKNKKQGFISVFAIFFSAIIVSVLTALYILLLKQIEILNMDSTSFQTLYVADSAFECVINQEQKLQEEDSTKSVFYPTITSGGLTYNNLTNVPPDPCFLAGDSRVLSGPSSYIIDGRSSTTMSISLDLGVIGVIDEEYCAFIIGNRETRITGLFVEAPKPDTLSIYGQNRNCDDTTNSKIVERLIEFQF